MATGDPWFYPLQACSCSLEVCRREGCILHARQQTGTNLDDYLRSISRPGAWTPKPRIRVKAGRQVVA